MGGRGNWRHGGQDGLGIASCCWRGDGPLVGRDGVAAELLQVAPPCADRLVDAAFSDRLMNSMTAEPLTSHAEDTSWDEAEARLLPKVGMPTHFTALQPISMLVASARLWPRWSFDRLSDFGVTGPWSANQAGLRRDCSCNQTVPLIRILVSYRAGTGGLCACLQQTTAFATHRCSEQCSVGESLQALNWPILGRCVGRSCGSLTMLG